MIEFIVTPEARRQLREAITEAGNTETVGVRVAVIPGGCSGLQYSLEVVERAEEDDEVIVCEGVRIYIDPFSAQYLDGTTLDYETTIMGSGFIFENPNSLGQCGCGKSFYA